MIKYLKESKPELEKNEDDRKVRNSVEDILSTIKKMEIEQLEYIQKSLITILLQFSNCLIKKFRNV